MRLAAYEIDGLRAEGVIDGEIVHQLASGESILDLLSSDQTDREQAGERARRQPGVPLEDVRLRAPIAPPTMRDFVCFETHVEGVVRMGNPEAKVMPDWYDVPTFYFTNPMAMLGPGDAVAIPPGCELFDLELEVGVVIGKAGRDLTPEQAREHIAGFTIYNDFSARDLGARELRIGIGFAKAKDFANALGPWIVTADELEHYRDGDRLDLEMSAYVNGRRLGVDTLANMAWSFEEMIVYASRGTELHPGDVLGSGTCGSGCLAELWGRNGAFEPRPLLPGDEITLAVEGIGELSNHVVAASRRSQSARTSTSKPTGRADPMSTTTTTFLKPPSPPTSDVTDELRQRVSNMLRDIENGGIDAVRR